MTPSEKTEWLQTNFKHAFKAIPRREIVNRNGFDISKIQGIYQEAGVEFQRWDHVEFEDSASEIREVTPAFRPIFSAPQDSSHYIFRTPQVEIEPLRALKLKDVYLSWDARNAKSRAYYLFDKEKRLINGLFFGGMPFIDTVSAEFSQPVSFAEDVFMKFNIAHFLFDKYPRSHISKTEFGVSDSLIYYTNKYTKTIGNLTGLTFHGLANGTPRGTVFLKECICFSNSFNNVRHPMLNGSTSHVSALNDLRQAARVKFGDPSEPPVKYFLTRAAHLPRGIVNMPEITPLLLEHGFEIGDAADMDPVDQIRLFLRTTVLAGAHGAGLTNLIFQPDGAKLIELMPPLAASTSYWKSSGALDRQYCPVTCNDPDLGDIAAQQDTTHYGRDNKRQIFVPPERLEEALSN